MGGVLTAASDCCMQAIFAAPIITNHAITVRIHTNMTLLSGLHLGAPPFFSHSKNICVFSI